MIFVFNIVKTREFVFRFYEPVPSSFEIVEGVVELAFSSGQEKQRSTASRIYLAPFLDRLR